MNLRRARAFILLVASAASWASPSAAQPRPTTAARPLAQTLTGQAKADYDAGKTLAGDGDFPGALIKFQAAHDASKDPRLLWNVAFCEKNLRHYAKVIAILQRYQAEGAGYLSDKDRKDAQDLIATIQPFTTSATVRVSQDGAQIAIDDAPVGTSPLPGPIVLDIGERHLRVTKDGFKTFEKTLPVGGSAAVSVDVTLEAEVHEGRLVVNAPAGATITLDDKPVGTGKIDLSIASGGHQLRATAPGMRPFQTEVVVQDKETRQLDVTLDKELPPEKPRLRVAVGCDGPEPRGPEDGLVVTLDGPDVLQPVNVKRRWDDGQSRNVVEYVEYAVDAGQHTVRARIPDCTSLDTTVLVDPRAGGAVNGALESDSFPLFLGPQGSPGHWRVGVGAWTFSPGDRYQTKEMTEAYGGGLVSTTGFSVEGAFVLRWFGMFLNVADGFGSLQRKTFDTHDALPSSPSASAFETLFRLSFRIPFHYVSWNVIGPEAGLGRLDLENVNSGQLHAVFGAWTGLDIQPFCDWGVSVREESQFWTDTVDAHGPAVGLHFGLFYEPNSRCQRERSTQFGLRAGEPTK